MIVTEYIVFDGRQLVKTYSDSGYKVKRDGILYDAAFDPVNSGRIYTESGVPIEPEVATAEDYQAALARLGVDV